MKWLTKKRVTVGTPGQQLGEKARPNVFWPAVGAIVVLLVLWVLFAPGSGYLHYKKAQRQLGAIEQENLRLQRDNEALRQEIGRLKTDEAYLEEVARKKHGLLKKNERVYEFNSPGGK